MVLIYKPPFFATGTTLAPAATTNVNSFFSVITYTSSGSRSNAEFGFNINANGFLLICNISSSNTTTHGEIRDTNTIRYVPITDWLGRTPLNTTLEVVPYGPDDLNMQHWSRGLSIFPSSGNQIANTNYNGRTYTMMAINTAPVLTNPNISMNLVPYTFSGSSSDDVIFSMYNPIGDGEKVGAIIAYPYDNHPAGTPKNGTIFHRKMRTTGLGGTWDLLYAYTGMDKDEYYGSFGTKYGIVSANNTHLSFNSTWRNTNYSILNSITVKWTFVFFRHDPYETCICEDFTADGSGNVLVETTWDLPPAHIIFKDVTQAGYLSVLTKKWFNYGRAMHIYEGGYDTGYGAGYSVVETDPGTIQISGLNPSSRYIGIFIRN